MVHTVSLKSLRANVDESEIEDWLIAAHGPVDRWYCCGDRNGHFFERMGFHGQRTPGVADPMQRDDTVLFMKEAKTYETHLEFDCHDVRDARSFTLKFL